MSIQKQKNLLIFSMKPICEKFTKKIGFLTPRQCTSGNFGSQETVYTSALKYLFSVKILSQQLLKWLITLDPPTHNAPPPPLFFMENPIFFTLDFINIYGNPKFVHFLMKHKVKMGFFGLDKGVFDLKATVQTDFV